MEGIRKGRIQNIEVSKLIVSENNVRKYDPKTDPELEDLKISIQKIGLLQPIVVFQKDEKYEIVIGQRRFNAIKELKWETIPAVIIDPLEPIQAKIYSLGENLHRKQLPYNDAVEACNFLYKRYNSVEQVAKELGVSYSTVTKYLKAEAIPQEIRNMVHERKISHDKAIRIVDAYQNDKSKAIEMAHNVMKMTKPEADRAIQIAKKAPTKPPVEVVKEAKKPPEIYTVQIHLTKEYWDALGKASVNLGGGESMNISDVVLNAVEEWLHDKGYI